MNLGLFLYLLALPVAESDMGEDYGQRIDRLSTIATVITEESNGNREFQAFVAVQGYHESNYALKVQLCNCDPGKCDNGAAHGYWSHHRAPRQSHVEWWGYCGDTAEAVRAGVRRLWHFFDRRNLEASFARMGGIRASTHDRWVVVRSNETRWLARKL
jgi:hypothetical protein